MRSVRQKMLVARDQRLDLAGHLIELATELAQFIFSRDERPFDARSKLASSQLFRHLPKSDDWLDQIHRQNIAADPGGENQKCYPRQQEDQRRAERARAVHE